MKIVECPQYSPEYWEAKRGIASSSNFSRIFTAKTMKMSASADDYIAELLADVASYTPPFFSETSTGRTTPEMQHGLDCEPEARRYYEFHRSCDVRQVGVCITDDGRFCCSPDGLVGDDGLLELKCPLLKTQARYLMAGTLPDDYKQQVHGQLIVTGRKWVDFLSYATGLPPLLLRVEPDEYTEALRAALDVFYDRLQDALAKFEAMEATV